MDSAVGHLRGIVNAGWNEVVRSLSCAGGLCGGFGFARSRIFIGVRGGEYFIANGLVFEGQGDVDGDQ
tara:strand:+ start:580 stop:783 length:204 start_codon:yes stop_codon:yes gene_type:complete